MRNYFVVLSMALFLGSPALAQAPGGQAAPALTTQQERMKSCNAEAKTKGLKGDARKTFMSECLSGKTAAATSEGTAEQTADKPSEKKLTPQQAKMKSCNADAGTKGLKGEERKKFMSNCLKG